MTDGAHLDELRLARSAAQGDADAVRQVDALIAPEAAAAARRIDPSATFVDEVRQVLRVRLLVGENAPPRIAEYQGRGPLRAWIGVAALRTALNLRRGVRATADVDVIAELASAEPDPELRHLKTLYRAEFREALEAALAALSERDRAILRLVYVDGLRLAQLGKLYGVHESTASRWVKSAVEAVAEGARRRLIARLSISATSVDQIAQMVRSTLDLSIARLLR
jgi:RNA polymerase sigma-70 factor, ECF subfamily